MPKAFITPSYTFSPGASGVGTLNLSGIASFDIRRLVAVINQTRGVVIYATGSAAARYTAIAGSTLTLNVDTSTHNAADALQIIYEDPAATPVSAASLPLPAGAATAALQSDANAKLDGLTENGELVQAVEALRMAVQSLTRSVGLSTVDTAGRQRVLVDSFSAGVSLSALNTVGTVNTMSNQTNIGGFAAADKIPALMHLSADNLRRNITVT